MQQVQARILFPSKMAIVRHLLKQVPEGEKPHGPTMAQQANELIAKLPEDMQQSLGTVKDKDVYNAIRLERMKAATGRTETTAQSGRQIIRWTNAEQDILADKITQLRLEQPLETFVELCIKAQQELPLARRRSLRLLKEVKMLLPKVQIRLDNLKHKAERASKPEPTPVAPPPPPSTEEVLAGLQDETLVYYLLNERKVAWSVLLPAVLESYLLDQSQQQFHENRLTALAATLARQNEKLDMLLDYHTKGPEPTAPRHESNGTAIKKDLLRVSVCGLKSDQFQVLLRTCRDKVVLRYLSKDIKTPPFSSNDDYALLFIDFIGHDLEAQALQTMGKDKVLRHRGGLSQAIELLLTLAKNKTPA